MKAPGIIVGWIMLISVSCTFPKEGRQLKSATKDWRTSPVVLEGYGDSPLGGTVLRLRENEKFELSSSGFFMVQFEAGRWKLNQDTIVLTYLDKQQNPFRSEGIAIDRETSTLIFKHPSESTYLRLRLIKNKL